MIYHQTTRHQHLANRLRFEWYNYALTVRYITFLASSVFERSQKSPQYTGIVCCKVACQCMPGTVQANIKVMVGTLGVWLRHFARDVCNLLSIEQGSRDTYSAKRRLQHSFHWTHHTKREWQRHCQVACKQDSCKTSCIAESASSDMCTGMMNAHLGCNLVSVALVHVGAQK